MRRKFWHFWLCFGLLFSLNTAHAQTQPAGSGFYPEAQTLLENLTPAERVGQLFLVSFEGSTLPPEGGLTELINTYHIGGVVLLAEKNNIPPPTPQTSTPAQLLQFTNQLQTLALVGQLPPAADPTPTPSTIQQVGLPLFIATRHNGYSHTEIMSGLTEIPSPMAIGATWKPFYAQQIGEIVGQELTAMGINMLWGPDLDVVDNSLLATTNGNQIGNQSFGGHPYWVSQMGQAYLTGLEVGSQNRLALIATHFPGRGSSDRPTTSEIPTVRKTFDQLRQTELLPFLTSTSHLDGLLLTHVRYQGLQGNIRATTPPLTFDPQALSNLFQLPQLASWRTAGGILVSDSLGVTAIEQFYDATNQEFPHRQVAKDALFAGNDLLFVDQFALGSAPYAEQLANIEDTILWFQEKYETDPAFRQRIDQAVLNILQLKLKLYEGDLRVENILRPEDNLPGQLTSQQAQVFEVAQNALTLLAPSPAELQERLPGPPTLTDKIVIFTDVQTRQQCPTCPAEPLIGVSDLADRMLALYGPAASGQIQPQQLQTFSFADLQLYLNAPRPILPPPTPVPPTPTITPSATSTNTLLLPTPTPAEAFARPTATTTPSPAYKIQEALAESTWLIFAFADTPAGQQSPLQQFLAQRPDLVRQNHVIALSFSAPLYLDTTEVSKLTAYFGLYSSSDSFISAAVRAMFRDLTPTGRAPISVPGVGYDLTTVLQPDPNQLIGLSLLDIRNEERVIPADSPLELIPGETLRLQTGVIKDMNGSPVPDGTVVQFTLQDRIQGFYSIIATAATVNGRATFDYVLVNRPGQFRITASAGPAITSEQVDIAIEENISIIVISPTPAPTATPTPEPTFTAVPPTFTPEPTPTPPPPVQEDTLVVNLSSSQLAHFMGLMGGLLSTITITGLFHRLIRPSHPAEQFRTLLWGLVGSLIFYNYFLLQGPGILFLVAYGGLGAFVATLAGGLLGLISHRLQQ